VCQFRVSGQTAKELTEWKQAFQSLTLVDLKSRRGAKQHGISFLYQDTFICQHGGGTHIPEVPITNTKGDPHRSKRIRCPSLLWVGLRRITDYTLRSYSRLPEFPTWVKMIWNHNHVLHSARTLSHRTLSSTTMSLLQTLFLKGLTWQGAYTSCRSEVELRHAQEEFGDRSLESTMADSSICPTKRQVRYRFQPFDQEMHGQRNGEALWNHVEDFCATYNTIAQWVDPYAFTVPKNGGRGS
jgi:hypothetical protein